MAEATLLPRPTTARRARYPGHGLPTRVVAAYARRCVAEALGLDVVLLASDRRGARQVAFGRQLAIHLCHIVAGRSHHDVARAFRRNRSTASHHFGVVEDLRDAEEFDRFVDMLERRFVLTLELAALGGPRSEWRAALGHLSRVSADPRVDETVRRQAQYVACTFGESDG